MRVVHGDKELIEKLGRNDPCPCGSGLRFQAVLPRVRLLSTAQSVTIIGDNPSSRGRRGPTLASALQAVSRSCHLSPEAGGRRSKS
ncbi:SEC-C metal-binding domain-containing protein [Sphingomonas melonis]|uniref:SEC-C metal-binding domain-containing protein n=1 Tax=Sphingomonas melonis TaxID=152682 RepID=UPI00359C36DD